MRNSHGALRVVAGLRAGQTTSLNATQCASNELKVPQGGGPRRWAVPCAWAVRPPECTGGTDRDGGCAVQGPPWRLSVCATPGRQSPEKEHATRIAYKNVQSVLQKRNDKLGARPPQCAKQLCLGDASLPVGSGRPPTLGGPADVQSTFPRLQIRSHVHILSPRCRVRAASCCHSPHASRACAKHHPGSSWAGHAAL